MVAKRARITALLLLAPLLVGAAWFLLTVSPSHWMRRVHVGTVQIDQHPVVADIYFANPNGEAEAVVLIRLKNGDAYFLDFGSEKVRPATDSEYLSLLGGVWSYRALPNGTFRPPLPFEKLNEFRIAERDGHVLSVQF